MANKEYPLSIILRLVDKATAGVSRVVAKVGRAGKQMERVGASMSAGLTAPIVAAGAASTVAFAQFEQGISNISTLVDTSTESMEDMGKTVLAIGRRVPVALSDLTGALYDVRSAGTSAADQFTVLEQSARLGVAGLGTTKQAVDLATSSINAFGLKGAEAEAVYDQIFKTVKNGKTDIAQLSQGFGGVAGTVAASGTKLDEYLASVAALTTTGLPAAEAHTQLKAVISGLTRETDKSRKVFRKLGAKDFKDLIAESGGLVPALEKVKSQLGGDQAAILDLVGSTEALNAVLGLTGAQSGTFRTTLDSMRNGANAVDEAFEKQNATMLAKAQRTKNAMAAVGVSIGRILAPALEKLGVILQAMADWWEGLNTTVQKVIVTFALVVSAIGPLLIIAAKLIALGPSFVILFGAIKSVILVVKGLAVALFTTPVGWFILGIVALVAAGYLLIKNWDKVKLFLISMWEVVKEYFATFLDWVKFAFLNFSPIGLIIQHWEPIKGFFVALWDGVTAAFEHAWTVIEGIVAKITGVVSTVTGAVDSVIGAVGGAGDAIGSFFGGGEDEAPAGGGMRMGPNIATGGVERLAAGNTTSSAAVSVNFANAPRGTRVESDRRNTAVVDLSVGYQMGGL